MWKNSCKSHAHECLLQPDKSGWLLLDNVYSIDCECEEVKARVKHSRLFNKRLQLQKKNNVNLQDAAVGVITNNVGQVVSAYYA